MGQPYGYPGRLSFLAPHALALHHHLISLHQKWGNVELTTGQRTCTGHIDLVHEDRSDESACRHQTDGATGPFGLRAPRQLFSTPTAFGGIDRSNLAACGYMHGSDTDASSERDPSAAIGCAAAANDTHL